MRTLFLCLLLLSSTFCLAQDEAQLEKYIQQLGHEDYTVREHAEQQIIRAGARSIPLLKKALESGDAEISWRAETLIDEINANLKKNTKEPLPKKEAPIFEEEPSETEEEPFEMRPLRKNTQNSQKGFFSGSFTIFQNGNLFKVQTLSDGSFKVSTEEVNANGKKESNTYTYLSEDEFQEKNPELYKRYKKASEGVFFERIRPKTRTPDPSQDPSGGFGFSFGQSGFDSNDFSDITDILQELLQNDGQIDLNRILQKQSTQRLMDRFLDSMAEDDPQLQQMLEMQRQMMKQFGLLNDEDANPFGGSQVRPKKSPPKRVAPPKKEPKGTFEQTMEAYSFPGLELAPMTDALKSQIKERGVVIAKAEEYAKEVGLKKFDILLSINGYETQSPEDALKIISKLKKGEKVTLQLLRKLERTSISFTY